MSRTKGGNGCYLLTLASSKCSSDLWLKSTCGLLAGQDFWQGRTAVLYPSVPFSPEALEDLHLSMAGRSVCCRPRLEDGWLILIFSFFPSPGLQQPVQLVAVSRMFAEEQTCLASWTCKLSLCFLNSACATSTCSCFKNWTQQLGPAGGGTLLLLLCLDSRVSCFCRSVSGTRLLHSSLRARWLILTIMFVLAVLLGHGSIFFTPKKTVSGLAFLRQRVTCPCSVELLNLIHILLVICIAKLRKHLSWLFFCISQLEKLCILKIYVGGWICTLSSCSTSEKSEHFAPWLTVIWCDCKTVFFGGKAIQFGLDRMYERCLLTVNSLFFF